LTLRELPLRGLPLRDAGAMRGVGAIIITGHGDAADAGDRDNDVGAIHELPLLSL